VVVVLAVTVFSIGLLGPHVPDGKNATPTASLTAAVTAGATPRATATPRLPSDLDGLSGLARLQPAASDMRTSWLPPNISSETLAAVGTRLYFVAESNQLETIAIGADIPARTIVSVGRCQAITQVAAAGNSLAYLVVSPAAVAPGVTGCGRSAGVDWSIWLSDAFGGHRRLLASGSRKVATAADRLHPVRVALTPSLVAFSSHNSPGTMALGETVEVLRLADLRLMWTVRTSGAVRDLLLGGSTVAVLEEEDGFAVAVADAINPALFPIARQVTGVALSEDGHYLAWDTPPDQSLGGASGLVTVALPSGSRDPLSTPGPAGTALAAPLKPAVTTAAGGPILAWYQTVAGGVVYPAFRTRDSTHGFAISSVPAPAWIELQGSTLILLSTDDDGRYTVAYAIDLSASGFGGSSDGGGGQLRAFRPIRPDRDARQAPDSPAP
jgi:hypothetical protein